MTNDFLTSRFFLVVPQSSLNKGHRLSGGFTNNFSVTPQSCGTSFKCTRFIGSECFREVEKERANYDAFVTHTLWVSSVTLCVGISEFLFGFGACLENPYYNI